MTRKLAGLAVVATAMVAVAAKPADAVPPEFDKAEGAGTYGGTCITFPPGTPLAGTVFCPPQRSFSFSAIERGFGERGQGFYTQQNLVSGTGRITGRVTCLTVLGDTAVFGGTIADAAVAEVIGLPFVVWVVDNGPSGGVLPDLISPFFFIFDEIDRETAGTTAAFPNVCPQPFPSPIGYFPVTSGNIVVEDESAGPPSVALE